MNYSDFAYFDHPYVQGRCAYEDGKGSATNPYEEGSHEWKDWLSGYNDMRCRMEG